MPSVTRGIEAVVILSLLAAAGAAQAARPPLPAAEIVSIEGTGETRESAQGTWQAASVHQKLDEGSYVRTAAYSRMGLLFGDRTQIRLRERSVLEVKSVAKKKDQGTVLRLTVGRAWAQLKSLFRGLSFETPSATAAIRGTDWELAVEQDGTSTITVLNGEVEFSNDLGRVTVKANEQARAEVGKPPVKMIVVNPRERVQWVTAYPVDTLRHISLSGSLSASLQMDLEAATAESAGRGALLADLGRWKEAQEAFSLAAQKDRENGPALLGLAFSRLRSGDPREAGKLIAAAEKAKVPPDRELASLARSAALLQGGRFGEAAASLENMTRSPDLRQPAAYLILSDLMIYFGERAEAARFAEEALRRFPASALPACQLARLALIDDRPGDAAKWAGEALARDKDSVEAQIVLGDAARLNGDADAAIGHYTRAISLKPHDDRGWYGLGVVHTEREDARKARKTLDRALDLNPSGAGYEGQRGTLASFAGRFAAAERSYEKALGDDPNDFVALTGRGILELKRGNTKAALDAFLRAEILEPRYARIQIYKAVAYYQLGLRVQAKETLRRAGELDAKDPLPHFMAGVIHADLYEPGGALQEAREALRLMPFLKSLNHLASDRQGSANLGRAFAYFGLEEWAQSYAQESYYPFWAGSHLFLADRYAGFYTKNSELFQGYLADPSVFGAGNRFQSLLPLPGDYATAGFRYGKNNAQEAMMPTVQMNGLWNGVRPLSYFINYEPTEIEDGRENVQWNALTVGVGAKPTHELGAFFFGNAVDIEQNIDRTEGGFLFDLDDELNASRGDMGIHYAFTPTSQLWLKAGSFTSTDDITGAISGGRTLVSVVVEQPEFSLRHTFDAGGGNEVTWGGEYSVRDTDSSFFQEAAPGMFLDSLSSFVDRSHDLYLSDRYSPTSKLLIQVDLPYQKHTRRAAYVDSAVIPPVPPAVIGTAEEETSTSGVNPRVGLVYRFDEARLVRVAYQSWVRPSGFSSLGPVATAGIPLQDRLVASGGELERVRGQFEWEWSKRTFTSLFVDNSRVENRPFQQTPFTLTEIEDLFKLQERNFATLASDDLLESTPEFVQGTVTSAGIGVNQVLTEQWSTFARYAYTRTRNTGPDFPGNDLPHLPRHAGAVGTTWIGPLHLFFITRFTYRDERFTDEANTDRLLPGWDGSADLFWESPRKHLLARVGADEMFDRNEATFYSAEILIKY